MRWKRWDLVVRAIALLPPGVRERVSFTHIGAPERDADSATYVRELDALARRSGIADQVTWSGAQPSSAALLAAVDCTVVASQREPFSMIALESLYAGVPVLSADDGGPVDFIDDGRSGWFFRSGDATDLMRTIRDLLETDAFSRVDIDRGRLTRFSATRVADTWRRIYEKVASP